MKKTSGAEILLIYKPKSGENMYTQELVWVQNSIIHDVQQAKESKAHELTKEKNEVWYNQH